MHTFLNVLGALDRAQQEALNRCLLLRYQCSGSSAGSEWRQALFLLKPPVQLTMGVVANVWLGYKQKGPSAAEGSRLMSGQSTCVASTDEPLNARVAESQPENQHEVGPTTFPTPEKKGKPAQVRAPIHSLLSQTW